MSLEFSRRQFVAAAAAGIPLPAFLRAEEPQLKREKSKGTQLVSQACPSSLGLPGGRIVDCKPSFFAVFAFHSADPSGWPRPIDSRTASCSAFVSARFTRWTQFAGRIKD